MKSYIVRIERDATPSAQPCFSPIILEFPEPLSFQELACLRNILQEKETERIEQKLSRALSCLKEQFSLQGRIVDVSVSAKILV